MKKPSVKTFLTVLLVVLTVFSFTGCEFLADLLAVLAAPSGYVVNAKTGEPIDDAIVTLTSISSGLSEAEATTSSSGFYTFADVEYGTFELSASLDGYVFTKQVIEVSGLSQSLPLIGGFVPGNEVFSVVVLWDEDFADIDAFLSFPNDYSGSATVNPLDFYSTVDSVPAGFFPEGEDSIYRNAVHSDNKLVGTETEPEVELDVDNVGGIDQMKGGPESVSVYYIPFIPSTYPSEDYSPVAADRSGFDLTLGLDYAWVGVMEYSLGTWTDVNDNLTDSDSLNDNDFGTQNEDALLVSADPTAMAANPIVYIFDGSGQKGLFRLPSYMDIETASVLRINMFYGSDEAEYFQFLPDVRAYSDRDSIDKGLLSEPIVIKGKTRR